MDATTLFFLPVIVHAEDSRVLLDIAGDFDVMSVPAGLRFYSSGKAQDIRRWKYVRHCVLSRAPPRDDKTCLDSLLKTVFTRLSLSCLTVGSWASCWEKTFLSQCLECCANSSHVQQLPQCFQDSHATGLRFYSASSTSIVVVSR